GNVQFDGGGVYRRWIGLWGGKSRRAHTSTEIVNIRGEGSDGIGNMALE
ncbi:hypothetical protein A2U01_0118572, partial [Trifolium medium]|nr:hypothetical protein [Trifolium medium]